MVEEKEIIEVGEPVKVVPPPRAGMGKYTEYYAQVDQLHAGEWLPVTTRTLRQAQRLQECAKLKGYLAKRRMLTVYLSKTSKGQPS